MQLRDLKEEKVSSQVRQDTCEFDLLLEFQVAHVAECCIHIIQGEGGEIARLLAGQVLVIHEHLPHLVAWRSCINWRLQLELSNQVWQCPQVAWVRVRDDNNVNVRDDLQKPFSQLIQLGEPCIDPITPLLRRVNLMLTFKAVS